MNRPQFWTPQVGTWRSQAHAVQCNQALPPQLPCVFSFCVVTHLFLPRALQEGSHFWMKCLVKRLVGSEWRLGLKVTFSLVFSVDFSALWKLCIPSSSCLRLHGPLHMPVPSHCTPSHQTSTPAGAHPGPLTGQSYPFTRQCKENPTSRGSQVSGLYQRLWQEKHFHFQDVLGALSKGCRKLICH